jgi:hypothetical protein
MASTLRCSAVRSPRCSMGQGGGRPASSSIRHPAATGQQAAGSVGGGVCGEGSASVVCCSAPGPHPTTGAGGRGGKGHGRACGSHGGGGCAQAGRAKAVCRRGPSRCGRRMCCAGSWGHRAATAAGAAALPACSAQVRRWQRRWQRW